MLSTDEATNLELRQAVRRLSSSVRQGAVNREDVGYDIVVIWGASNSVGYGLGIDLTRDYNSERVLMLPTSGVNNGIIVQATEPLQHREIRVNEIGTFHGLGKRIAEVLPLNRRVFLLPAALSGNGFAENSWNPGNGLYNDTVSRINTLLAANPNNRLLMFANYLHGGQDKDMAATAYRNAWLAFIDALRTLYGNVPFFVGSYSDSALPLDSSARQQAQTNWLTNVQPARPLLYFINGTGLASVADNLHFNAASHRVLVDRWFNVFLSHLRNVG